MWVIKIYYNKYTSVDIYFNCIYNILNIPNIVISLADSMITIGWQNCNCLHFYWTQKVYKKYMLSEVTKNQWGLFNDTWHPLCDPLGCCEHSAVSITFVGLNILTSDIHLRLYALVFQITLFYIYSIVFSNRYSFEMVYNRSV